MNIKHWINDLISIVLLHPFLTAMCIFSGVYFIKLMMNCARLINLIINDRTTKMGDIERVKVFTYYPTLMKSRKFKVIE